MTIAKVLRQKIITEKYKKINNNRKIKNKK